MMPFFLLNLSSSFRRTVPYSILFFLITFTVANSLIPDLKYKQKRYIIGEDSVGRHEAQRRCRSNRAELATIQSPDDFKSIKAFLEREPNGYKFWISGFYRPNDHCNREPNQTQCWFWDTTGREIVFNPDIIQFTNTSQARIPNSSSRMILLKKDPLTLDFDESTSIHVYLCDRAPSTPMSDICKCLH